LTKELLRDILLRIKAVTGKRSSPRAKRAAAGESAVTRPDRVIPEPQKKALCAETLPFSALRRFELRPPAKSGGTVPLHPDVFGVLFVF